ncbi:MAG: hypothetical protein R3C11_29100 [Planctomycetaceae bacterium]
MDHFGIDFQQGNVEIIPEINLPIAEQQVICFTGPSGSGKSSLLREVSRQLDGVLNIEQLTWEEKPLIDLLTSRQDGLALLVACGLGEGRLALRSPSELSDGQRFRFKLALGFSKKPKWLVCDEFTATLDRLLAELVSLNMQRLSERYQVGLLLATTHEDIISSLKPDLHVRCLGGNRVEWKLGEGKKKETTSTSGSGSAQEPKPTGRTSLGGIIEAITWAAAAR